MFEGKYTTMGSRSTLHPRVVRGQLNRNLCKPWKFRHKFHVHSDNGVMVRDGDE